MIHAHSVKSIRFKPGTGNQRLLLVVGILLGHLCLIVFLILLPQEHHEESTPQPMVMVELQPPVPLSAGNSQNTSRQAVTASSPSASVSDASEEGESGGVYTSPTHRSSRMNPAKAENLPKNTPAPIAPALAKTAVASASASETALSGPSAASASSGTGNENSKGNTSIASASPTSGGAGNHASAPQYGAGYLSNPAPEYPSLARSMGEEGKVLLHVLVTPEGLAKKVKLHRTSGSDSLDDAAIKAVKKWRFVPAKLGEQAVEAWVYVPIVFKLD